MSEIQPQQHRVFVEETRTCRLRHSIRKQTLPDKAMKCDREG